MADPADFANIPPGHANAYGPGITAGDAMAAIGQPQRPRQMPDTVTGTDPRLGDTTYRYTGAGVRAGPIPGSWRGSPTAQSGDRT